MLSDISSVESFIALFKVPTPVCTPFILLSMSGTVYCIFVIFPIGDTVTPVIS